MVGWNGTRKDTSNHNGRILVELYASGPSVPYASHSRGGSAGVHENEAVVTQPLVVFYDLRAQPFVVHTEGAKREAGKDGGLCGDHVEGVDFSSTYI